MVWTSDYPQDRPEKAKPSQGAQATASKPGAGSSTSANTAQKSSSSSKSSFDYASGASSPKSGSASIPDYAKPAADSVKSVNPISPISGFKPEKPPGKPPSKPGIFLILFGVMLPVAALAVELTSHICAKSFFDPLPTPAHVLLISLIPLTNLMVWVAGRRNMTDMLGMLTLGTGMSMGVAILYSLMFLPLVPLSIVAILWFGFGLLALSPLLAVPAIWKAGKFAVHLSHSHKTYFDGHQLEHIGHLIILCTVVAVELPSTLTRMHIGEAAHSAKPVAALEWLRNFGNPEVMLRACYERSGRATDILGSLYEVKNPTNVEEARRIFYQVTGKPFNSVPLPAALRATRQNQGLLDDGESEEPNVDDEFDQDPDIAGEAVSGVARGLTLNESRLSGFVDGNSAISNLFWRFSFGNTSKYDREVRSKILLPPGAVITNAYLIVDGTEREAQVMGRNLARSRYRAAVAEKKDPLLVSTCGADTVLLQLYPVKPESKTSVRLNIVSPLTVTAMDKAELALPTFEERNFQADIPTAVSLRSDRLHLGSTAKELKVPLDAQNTVVGSLSTPELARFAAVVTAERDPDCTFLTSMDGAESVSETIKKKTYPRPGRLTVVIDGSNGMSPHFASILKELDQLPGDMVLKLVFLRDGETSAVIPANQPALRSKYLKEIEKIACAGGQINQPILKQEIADALNHEDSAVLWLHAAQPIPGSLGKVLEENVRRRNKPVLYDFAVAAGPNEVLSGLYACPGLVRVDRGANVQSDLHRLFEEWRHSTANAPSGGIEYRRVGKLDAEAKNADPSLAKLVAFDEISKIQTVHSGHRCKYARQAVFLANKYHLVTSFSSAIITEPIPQKTVVHNVVPKRSPVMLSAAPPDSSSWQHPKGALSFPQLPNMMPMMMQESRIGSEQLKRLEALDTLHAARDAEKQVYYSKRAPQLQGSTNGTVSPQSQGSQFGGSTSLTAPLSFAENAPVQAQMAQPEPASAPVPQFAAASAGGSAAGKDLGFLSSHKEGLLMAKAKTANEVEVSDFRESPRRKSALRDDLLVSREEKWAQ